VRPVRPCRDDSPDHSTHSTERRSLGPDREEEERERRAASDQGLSREGSAGELVELVCECSDPNCEELISLTVEEREFARSVPNRFVVKVGHADEEIERVLIEEPGRFNVLEKFGSAGDVVAHLHPVRKRR
jgi:hypothetical protein